MTLPSRNFYVDLCGGCNLRCPSCPEGSRSTPKNPKGFISPDLLDQILAKAKCECRIISLSLFSWSEPLLHPALPELLSVVARHGLTCILSTNLNLDRPLLPLLNSCVDLVRISVSGFYQEVYGRTHRGGNIERVKSHLRELARLKSEKASPTRVDVVFHQYRENAEDEIHMRCFVEELGLSFRTTQAFLLPLEKVAAYLQRVPGSLDEEDLSLASNLLIPLDRLNEFLRLFRGCFCNFKRRHISINFLGEIQTCCLVYDRVRFGLGNYLETDWTELMRRANSHPFCVECTQMGLHACYEGQSPEVDQFTQLCLRESPARAHGRAPNPLTLAARSCTVLSQPSLALRRWIRRHPWLMHQLDAFRDL